MATLQVKGFDDQLYKALGARAAMDHRSVSQEVVAMIREFLARPGREARETTMAFLGICGSWTDPRPARDIARSLRKARRSGRRFSARDDVFA